MQIRTFYKSVWKVSPEDQSLNLRNLNLWNLSHLVSRFSYRTTSDQDMLLFNWRYTNAGLKISLLLCVHIKTILWKFRILNPRNSLVICREVCKFHIKTKTLSDFQICISVPLICIYQNSQSFWLRDIREHSLLLL